MRRVFSIVERGTIISPLFSRRIEIVGSPLPSCATAWVGQKALCLYLHDRRIRAAERTADGPAIENAVSLPDRRPEPPQRNLAHCSGRANVSARPCPQPAH